MRAVVHIGTEKTATTTLQEFVYHNRAQLLKAGIALSDELFPLNNRKLPLYCFHDDQYDDFFKSHKILNPEAKAKYFEGFEASFEAEVKAAENQGADVFFITSEHFHSRLRKPECLEKLKAFLDRFFTETTIVCYVREQASLVKSLYSTSIKVGSSASLQKFSEECTPQNLYYNYQKLFNHWSAFFAVENIVVRLFSKQAFHGGDIRKDILTLIKHDIDLSMFDYSVNHSNTSLGYVGIQLGILNNSINPRFNKDGSPNSLRIEAMKLIEQSPASAHGKIPFPQAGDIYAMFDETNRGFAKTYLGIDGNPFTAPKPTKDEELTVPLSDLKSLIEDLMWLAKTWQSVPREYGETLRDIAYKLENHKDFPLSDAAVLLEVALAIRPHGPVIRNRLSEVYKRINSGEE